MATQQDNNQSRYMAVDNIRNGVVRYQVVQVPGYSVVDSCRTYRSAVHAASLLNTGDAIVDHHGTLGCRIMPSRKI